MSRQQKFDGETIEPCDVPRLGKQSQAVFDLMKDGHWRTLTAIAVLTGYPEASVSARLRDFRKPKFGGHQVERERRVEGLGTWVYRLIIRDSNEKTVQQKMF